MYKLSKKTISTGIWAYIFFFIAIEPAAFQKFSLTKSFFDVAHFSMLIVCSIFFFWNFTITNFKKKRICILMIIYYTFFLIVTFINQGMVKALATQAIQFIGFALYMDIVAKNNPKQIFKSALNILTLYVFFNCIIVYVIPDGLYETEYFSNNYLLGYDNQNINFILPTMVLVLLKNQCYKKCKAQVIFTYVLSWLTAIKIWSGMTLVVVSLMTIVAVFCFRKKEGLIQRHIFQGWIFNFWNFLIADLVMNFALVVLRVQYYFSYIIGDVLHKDLTLTGRTYIWDQTFEFIKENPIFGYGKEHYELRAVKYGVKEDSPFGLHAHNRFLETIYSGGIVLFGIFMFIMFYAASCLKKYKNTMFAKILSIGIFIYLIGMLTEYYDYCLFLWGFFVIAENADRYCTESF